MYAIVLEHKLVRCHWLTGSQALQRGGCVLYGCHTSVSISIPAVEALRSNRARAQLCSARNIRSRARLQSLTIACLARSSAHA